MLVEIFVLVSILEKTVPLLDAFDETLVNLASALNLSLQVLNERCLFVHFQIKGTFLLPTLDQALLYLHLRIRCGRCGWHLSGLVQLRLQMVDLFRALLQIGP